MYLFYMCELGNLHPIFIKCSRYDCSVALTIKDLLEEIWRKIKCAMICNE